jgi:radical SAM protein with 4Fe4S-binding SPASM domain
MGGYNSINNILAKKIPAIVFPRRTDQEQQQRCRIYKKCFDVMDDTCDSKEKIYQRIAKRLDTSVPERQMPPCDFNGAAKTARFIHAALHVRLVKIRLTTRCNCACDMCSWKNKPEVLPLSIVKQAIDQLSLLHLRAINFTGGEPTLYRHILTVLDYARQKNFVISLSTNGVMEQNKRQRLDPYIDCLDISIDSASGRIHDAIRKKTGAFRQAVETVHWMARRKKTIQINSVLRPDNFETIPDIIPLLGPDVSTFSFALADMTQNSLPHLKFTPAQLRKLYLDTAPAILKNAVASRVGVRIKPFFPDLEDKPPQEALWRLKEYRKRYADELGAIFGYPHRSCALAASTMRINPNGEISPCCSLDDYPSPIGNIFKNNLIDIITSDRYANFIKHAVPGRGRCVRCREGYRIYRHDVD